MIGPHKDGYGVVMDYVWELRNPDGGTLGLEWARALSSAHDVVLAHALPSRVDVVVRDESDRVVASAEGLDGEGETPMARLRLVDGAVTRESVWPTEEDLLLPVILPGGEVGVLISWWNAEDHSAWRWQLELSNSR
ncbi:MAG: hypothetical protein M3P04_03720 [Actinomycetota bacterium]|nr:hypothetical protein [Actinomycetota bacterium]